ncbi:MAG: ribosome biogenesis GTPase YlqF [Clostridiales bacterium]|nr:ribosome biogenesis GTPase YlqF [Clostridiales bacterium]
MDIHWYPGHMTRARRMIEESLARIDLVVEVLDARIPRASRNPDFNALFAGKKRVVVLNKSDLADRAVTKQWIERFESGGMPAVAVAAVSAGAKKKILACIDRAIAPEARRVRETRGVRKTFTVMVAGIPNVGKSTLINCLAGSTAARTGGKPGVTRGRQRVRITPYLELLDTPGLLWPKLEDPLNARHLAFTGAVRDETTDIPGLSLLLLEELARTYPDLLAGRYRIETDVVREVPARELLSAICRKRGFLAGGGEPDEERGAATILHEFRMGKLGAASLERPREEEAHGADADA